MRLTLAGLLGLAACGSPSFQLPSTLSVANLSPADGAVDVPVQAEQSACFSAPVDAASATAELFWVSDARDARLPELQVALAADPRCVSVTHAALEASKGYTLHVKAGVRAADGSSTLASDVQSHFTTGSAP